MDKVKQFEDLEVWKESMRLTVEIYKQLKYCEDLKISAIFYNLIKTRKEKIQ